MRTLLPLICTCSSVLLLIGWSCCCSSTANAQGDFLSIDCGLEDQPSYNDSVTGIRWISDAGLMISGESYKVDSSQFGVNSNFLGTMRLLNSNQSKYCYRLSEPWVQAGAFFLVRAWFWHGTLPPYFPQNGDTFRFKLLIDADQWWDVALRQNDTMYDRVEMYTRALRDSINVCLARNAADGDAPFISALELRALPSSLSATTLMASLNRSLFDPRHFAYGVPATSQLFHDIRYPSDSLDRIWQHVDSEEHVLNGTSVMDTSKIEDQDNMLPGTLFQTAYWNLGSIFFNKIADVSAEFYCVLYFAEIEPNVSAAGQRMFDIRYYIDDARQKNANPNTTVDVYAKVGPSAAYGLLVGPISSTPDGAVTIYFTATPSSTFPPFLSAAEFFQISKTVPSIGTSASDGQWISSPC